MGSSHQIGVYREDVQQRSKDERTLGEVPTDGKFRESDPRVDEELSRVVSRFAVNLN